MGRAAFVLLSEACCNSDFLPTINAVADFNGDNRADVVNVESFSSVAFWSSRSVTANTPPKVIAATPATIAQGSASVEILLATLSDAETPAGNLGYEVTTQPSLIVTNLRNDNGLLKGTPVIGCTTPAAVYQITVKASDTGGLSATGTLNLTVGANSAPEVGAYPTSTALARNGSTTITPAASVQDNGTTIVAVSAPTFTGNVSVNALGVVAVNQAGPAGSHSFAVTITDNCGATTKREFTVVVTDATGGGCDTPVFNEAENFNANQNPYGLTSGDFNGDGKPDLATTNIYDQTVTVLLASGNGFAKQPAIAVGVFPNAVVARDVNGDGKLDLVVVNRGSDTVTILLGNGDGTFARKGDYAVGNKSTGVAIGDFNGDGKADLILPNDGLGNAVVLDGNGDGSFAAPRYFYAGTSPQPPVVADFNRDGRDDVAFPNYSSGEVAILLGNGNGTFQSPIIIGNLGGAGVEAIAAGDLNGDGKLDIAVTNTTTNQVFTLLGDGQGGFTNGGGFATFSDYPASLVIADFTGDGKADIAVGG
ncbi:MAG: VCBS repeat-containing protein, partial [Blastocatellia bacterium]